MQKAKITLVHKDTKLINNVYPDKFRTYVGRRLTEAGVTLVLGDTLLDTAPDADGNVHTSNGKSIAADLVVRLIRVTILLTRMLMSTPIARRNRTMPQHRVRAHTPPRRRPPRPRRPRTRRTDPPSRRLPRNLRRRRHDVLARTKNDRQNHRARHHRRNQPARTERRREADKGV